MIKAGTREKQFIDLCDSLDDRLLSGKMSFENTERVYVSVDNTIVFDNEIILIEIDASNQAKLVSGQYTLLNLLQDKPSRRYKDIVKGKTLVFFVIHCYGSSEKNNKYNPERSKNNFKLINQLAFNNNGLKFGSIHIEDLTDKSINTKEKLLNKIKENIC
jgi:hypothetical protein